MKQETRDQLREILCEVPEVEKDIMEWKKWFQILMTHIPWAMMEYWWDEGAWWEQEEILEVWPDLETYWDYCITKDDNIQNGWHEEHECTYKIIWNPLQERNLRMYCDYINLYLIITTTWMISYIKKDNEMINTGIKLDNTKELEDQSEETGQKLIKFLLDNK